jgi:release factor glutamine methyltransferase
MADTLGGVLASATERLRRAGVDTARLDARLLAGHVLGLDTAAMVAHPERVLTAAEAAAVESLVARRERREPVARILGAREFFGLAFALSADTLEPRPDSETVVEAALAALGGIDAPRVLDLGTGTGCLLLAVLAARTDASGVGIDAAAGAVQAASANAAALGLAERATFRQRDWNAAGWTEGVGGPFDLVLANPPYIPAAEIAALQPEVRDFDPRLALDGGADGLDPYRRLVPELTNLLTPGGIAAFEVGAGQAAAVAAALVTEGLTEVGILPDLGGIERCVLGRRKGKAA